MSKSDPIVPSLREAQLNIEIGKSSKTPTPIDTDIIHGEGQWSQNTVENSLKTAKLLEALRTGDTQSLQILLKQYSVTPPTPNSANQPPAHVTPSPLHWAVQCSDIPTIEFVIAQGVVDINQKDRNGNTPLHLAAKIGRAGVVKLLLRQKVCNDGVFNGEGKQPIDLARSEEVRDLLIEHRNQFIEAKTNLMRQYIASNNISALDALFSDSRVSMFVNVNEPDSSGATLLHTAVSEKNLDLIQWLVVHGADVFARDKNGRLPSDLTKDEKLKKMLKNVPQSAIIPTAPGQMPKMQGYLSKWTNFAGGYKPRWFVLENGILSYYKNKEDSANACRGSLNMYSAKVKVDTSDKNRFEILGKGSVQYHLRADHPTEAKRWVFALLQSKQYLIDRAARDDTPRVGRVSISLDEGDSNWTDSSSIHGGEKRKSRLNASIAPAENESKSSSVRDRSPSPSEEIREESPPYHEAYPMSVHSARTQLEVQEQLINTLLQESKQQGNNSRLTALGAATYQSLETLRKLLDEIVEHSDARETYWRKRYEQEAERKGMWEESLRDLMMQQQDMEKAIQQSLQERRKYRAALKAIHAESTSDLVANLPPIPVEDEEHEDDDEFYDAVDNEEQVFTPAEIGDEEHREPWSETAEGGKGKGEAPGEAGEKEATGEEDSIAVSAHGYPAQYRTQLPLDPNAPKPEISLWSILKSNIGKDLTKISIPVVFNEPTSFLQRLCEDIEYSELLDTAARQHGAVERTMYVAAFAMSNYSSTNGRVVKPFNPLLGETFEYVRKDKGLRYIAEQVSHHPPISACYCDSPNYNFFADTDVKSKFWGKSFEIIPKGIVHCQLKVPNRFIEGAEGDGYTLEHYTWRKPTTCVNNLIIGQPWIDHYGDMIIKNHRTGEECQLTFKARGWRGKDAFEVRGKTFDARGNAIWELAGRWNDKLVARRIHPENSEELDSNTQAEEMTHKPRSTSSASITTRPVLLWRKSPTPDPPLPFMLTPFAVTLNDLADPLRLYLAPTDSRFRPDQRAMECGDYNKADEEKRRLEEKQRAKRRARERDPSIPPHTPQWFQKNIDQDTGEEFWEFTGEYWRERERRGREKSTGQGPGKWDIQDDDIF
ncbi:uncharacterized protein VTP21DRAFT_9343 [Calcarisporiella thermophila]|uniref:uncharacterized protein n=1 Tax=Calcarisporiella thermophila TaxID=911321 RepID=UPI003742AEFB